MEVLEQNFELVWAAKRRAVVNVRIGWVPMMLNLDCNDRFRTWIPASERRYLHTRDRRSAQTGRKDIKTRKNASPGYLFLINGDEKVKLYGCYGSH